MNLLSINNSLCLLDYGFHIKGYNQMGFGSPKGTHSSSGQGCRMANNPCIFASFLPVLIGAQLLLRLCPPPPPRLGSFPSLFAVPPVNPPPLLIRRSIEKGIRGTKSQWQWQQVCGQRVNSPVRSQWHQNGSLKGKFCP